MVEVGETATIPFPSRMVKVYMVVTRGVAVGFAIVAALSPVTGLHE